MEDEIKGMEQVLPDDHLRRGDRLQIGPAYRGGSSKEIAEQEQQKHKMLILQLGGEVPAYLVLAPFDRQRIGQAHQRQDKRRNLKADCIHAHHPHSQNYGRCNLT